MRAALDSRESEGMFLTTPVRWVDDQNGEMMAIGVGSVDGHPRRETMAILHSLARLTLTRSLTHEGHPAMSQTSLPQSGNQTPLRAVPTAIDQRSTPSSSRPQSRNQMSMTPMVPNATPAQSQPAPPAATSAVDQAATPVSSLPEERRPEQQAPQESDNVAPYPQSQPKVSSISSVTDQKPTLLSYPPAERPQQCNETAPGPSPAEPNYHNQAASLAQADMPSTKSNSPQQSSPPPTLTQKPAPLAERLHPHFKAPSSPPAKTLTTETPHDGMVVNGKPTGIEMPQRPATLERNETVYLTPPSDPSEIPNHFP